MKKFYRIVLFYVQTYLWYSWRPFNLARIDYTYTYNEQIQKRAWGVIGQVNGRLMSPLFKEARIATIQALEEMLQQLKNQNHGQETSESIEAKK
jgi:hypothetical protein